jgi:23S rRNA (guanine2445-N2)-methyltransferase / 23S rRNA (guanine2069-N7)-methyltransferase
MRAISASRENAENAGVTTPIVFRRQDILEFEPAPTPGVLITNPPYGERLGDEKMLVPLYEKLGAVLKGKFGGWKACVLTSSPDLANALGIKPKRRHRVFNGAIECQLLEFDL